MLISVRHRRSEISIEGARAATLCRAALNQTLALSTIIHAYMLAEPTTNSETFPSYGPSTKPQSFQ